jgi:hypothetical protein
MRIVIILAVAAIPVGAQSPTVQLTNATRLESSDFRIGDRFDIVVNGAADQPVSVRTTMNGRTDWGPCRRLDRRERPMVNQPAV